MSGDRHGQIISFYSYKGGVGRSLAVANAATLLAQRGRRVLVLDFDFEAPGLHKYFLHEDSGLDAGRVRPRRTRLPGLIDFFHELRAALDQHRDEGGDEAAGPWMDAVVERIFATGGYVYTVRVKNPNAGEDAYAELDFVAAGRLDAAYPGRVHEFDWHALYERYPEIFPALAYAWGRSYDRILIDSRTGVTDIGSICTMLLPEKLVLVFSPNNQSLEGALQVGEQAVRQRIESSDLRPLPLFPLVSRLENAEDELKRSWIRRARESFEAVFRAAYGLSACDLSAYFDRVRIPHTSYYAYDERIAAEREAVTEGQSLAQVFAEFVDCLELGNPTELKSPRATPHLASPLQVFIGSVEEDWPQIKSLFDHLRPLERRGALRLFAPHLAPAGEPFEESLRRGLTAAHVVVLMVSPAFLADDKMYEQVIPECQRLARLGRRILPVIVRAVDWQSTPLGQFQPLPVDGRPLVRVRFPDEVFQHIARTILQDAEANSPAAPG